MTTSYQKPKQKWSPRDYQMRALKLMMQQASVGLFLDPGLGKTSTVLAAFSTLKKLGYCKKMLIIAPLRPIYKVWPDEIEKWEEFGHLTYCHLHGPMKWAAVEEVQDADIYLINPEGVPWLFDERFKWWVKQQFDVLCIDESTKFKATDTRRFSALKKGLSQFKYRWILTGTPSPNGVKDLFGQIYILDDGDALGRYVTHFRSEYFVPGGFGGLDMTLKEGAFERIMEKVSPLVLQMSAEEYLQMPELNYVNIPIELPERARQIYDKVEKEFFAELDSGNIAASNAAAAGIKCRQICNGAVYYTMHGGGRGVQPVHDAKLEALEDLLEELGGRPTLLLYEFDHDRERIQKKFGDVPVLSSGLSIRKMEALVDRFNAGEIPILMGHPASMGHGLNLQGACHTVIWYGITWNLEYYDQAIARVYRQGQSSQHVNVYHLVTQDTLDETVLAVLQEKDDLQQGVLKAIASYRRDRHA